MYLDFVVWGMATHTTEGLKEYLLQPTWLTVKVWGHRKEEEAKAINRNSIATAKLSLLIETAFASFGGSANTVVNDYNRYLPFVIPDNSSLDPDTIDIFWECNNSGLLPNYVQNAIMKDKTLFEQLKNGRRV